jgi:PEGA domain-containing protein
VTTRRIRAEYAARVLALVFANGCALTPSPGRPSPALGPPEAEAPEPAVRIALFVLSASGEEFSASDSASISNAALDALRYAPEVEVARPDERVDLGDGRSIAECANDVPCIADRIRARRADLGIIIVANFAIAPPIVTARIIDAMRARVIKNALVETDAASLAPAVRGMTMDLVEASGHACGGRIAIETEPRDALVTLTSSPSGRSPRRAQDVFTAPPGRYRVVVSRPEYLTKSAWIESKRGTNTVLAISLERELTTPLSSPWLWVGVGGAALGASLVLALVLLRSSSPMTADVIQSAGPR